MKTASTDVVPRRRTRQGPQILVGSGGIPRLPHDAPLPGDDKLLPTAFPDRPDD